MKHLIIDTEQEAILRQAIIGVTAFLTARATRRDPLGMISKAYRLQERKCANLSFQLDQPSLATWQQIDMVAQAQFAHLLEAFQAAKSAPAKAVVYTQIHAFIAAQRAYPETAPALNQHIQGEITQ